MDEAAPQVKGDKGPVQTQDQPVHKAARFRRKPVNITAMRVTESSRQADAIRAWLGPFGSEPNTSVMRPGCVVVGWGRYAELAPPGYWVVRHADGTHSVCDHETFVRSYEPVDGAKSRP